MTDGESEHDGDAEDDEEEVAGGLREGDFVTLEYSAWTVEDDTLIDTTDQELAEEEGIDDEEHTFEPRTIVIGAGHLFEPLEDELVGEEVGDEGTVVVEAEEAFGEYDEEEVRTVSADKLDDNERRPGANVEVDGEQGIVETIIGGRARVDFNHPLAGDDIKYEYEVVDVVEDRERQAQELLKTNLDMELDVDIDTEEVTEQQRVEPDEEEEEDAEPEFEEVTVEKETLYVESTPQLSFNQQWMFQKQQIAQDIMDRVGVDQVVIREVIDGSGGGMMGGMGGMMGGMGGMGGGGEGLEEEDVDADELVEELEGGEE